MSHALQNMQGAMLRGMDAASGALSGRVDLEERVAVEHPLRLTRRIVDDARAGRDAEFAALCTKEVRPAIAPERVIRASLLRILFGVRPERQLMEKMDCNLLLRWIVGRRTDDPRVR